MKRVSIKNIAEELGISNATVYLVLSGKATEGRVRKEMCERIKHTAKLMNYQPNDLARNLRIGRSQTMVLIVADILNPFFKVDYIPIKEDIWNGMEKRFSSAEGVCESIAGRERSIGADRPLLPVVADV